MSPITTTAEAERAIDDLNALIEKLSGLMETEIARLTAEIHQMAGKPFNISSPQQLGRVQRQIRRAVKTRVGAERRALDARRKVAIGERSP